MLVPTMGNWPQVELTIVRIAIGNVDPAVLADEYSVDTGPYCDGVA